MTSISNYVKAFLQINAPMVQYLRDKKNRKVGVLVAYKKDGQVFVGWSKVNEAAGDTFDRERGIARAIDRDRVMYLEEFELNANVHLPNVPPFYYPIEENGDERWVKVSQYEDFAYRCKRYFSKPTRPAASKKKSAEIVNLEQYRAAARADLESANRLVNSTPAE